MTSQRFVYRCPVCGNIVEVEYAGKGALFCCGKEMELLMAKTADASAEKHVPYIERKDGGVLVRIGKETAHPMADDHHIVYIEICADGVYMKRFLAPGDAPEAFFKTDAESVEAWELCNKHGLWKA